MSSEKISNGCSVKFVMYCHGFFTNLTNISFILTQTNKITRFILSKRINVIKLYSLQVIFQYFNTFHKNMLGNQETVIKYLNKMNLARGTIFLA